MKPIKPALLVLVAAISFLSCQNPAVPPVQAAAPAIGPVASRALGAADFLKASGTVLRNKSGSGDIVDLRGTNLGG